jgi:hypothetical protein
MAINFRNTSPVRTCTKSYSNYRSYKTFLAKDFNNRCGYTDCSDFWFGGKNSFHIDHFKPWKKNPTLKTTYSNLVYCCSYVNILKSDDEGDYLDPCDVDFNTHFERDVNGNILPKASSVQAIYMHKKLKLYLKRYQIIWKLDEIVSRMGKLKTAINNPKNKPIQQELLILQGELGNELTTYLDYLRSNQ